MRCVAGNVALGDVEDGRQFADLPPVEAVRYASFMGTRINKSFFSAPLTLPP
jgi:hypothetical protein